jgi:hypothetical protein
MKVWKTGSLEVGVKVKSTPDFQTFSLPVLSLVKVS